MRIVEHHALSATASDRSLFDLASWNHNAGVGARLTRGILTTMTRLSSDSEEHDALEALKAKNRELELAVHLERLLRNGGGNMMTALRASGRQQIAERLADLGRAQFRGPISLVLDLEIPPVPNPPGLTAAAKGYIDLLDLDGLVIVDDRTIDHLIVLTHPGTDPEPTVSYLCTPISVLTADFDRAMRIANEAWPEPDGAPAQIVDGKAVEPGPAAWGRFHFTDTQRELLEYDEYILDTIAALDAEMEEQLAEDPDALVDYDAVGLHSSDRELTDPDVRDSVRIGLEACAGQARAHWLADQRIGAEDRPGPPPAWIAEVGDRDLADVELVDDNTPGTFILPAPENKAGTSSAWLAAIDGIFAGRIGQPDWCAAQFPVPIALDIALRGDAATFKDVDNRARDIIKAFTATFGPAFSGGGTVISGSRVYRLAEAPANDIRVRLLPESRLRDLAIRLTDARTFVTEHRRDRTRYLD
jgi:hypothetical protein